MTRDERRLKTWCAECLTAETAWWGGSLERLSLLPISFQVIYLGLSTVMELNDLIAEVHFAFSSLSSISMEAWFCSGFSNQYRWRKGASWVSSSHSNYLGLLHLISFGGLSERGFIWDFWHQDQSRQGIYIRHLLSIETSATPSLPWMESLHIPSNKWWHRVPIDLIQLMIYFSRASQDSHKVAFRRMSLSMEWDLIYLGPLRTLYLYPALRHHRNRTI